MKRIKNNIKQKLFFYMLFLALLLIVVLVLVLILFGRFENIKQNTYESLDVQMEVFEKDISAHFDYLVAAGIQFSEDITVLIEDYIEEHDLYLADLTDQSKHIYNIQEAMIEPMKQKLLQEECSGIFMMLDATVNSQLEESTRSKTGLYLQVNGYEMTQKNILLYRGLTEIGKKYDMMPHRKWRLEFNTDIFPNYDEIVYNARLPLYESYYFTDVCILPGTSEKVMLLTVPIIGKDNCFYGICGFEISESYFKTYHAQPTKIEHLTAILTKEEKNLLDVSLGLSCGGLDGYYRVPNEILTIKEMGDGLVFGEGKSSSYIGVVQSIQLSPNNQPYVMVVFIPEIDYKHSINTHFIQNVILILLLSFFIIICSFYFSKHFLKPILEDLEQIKLKNLDKEHASFSEMNDLFAFLANQDETYEKTLMHLEQEKECIREKMEKIQLEYEEAQRKYQIAQNEISRLVCYGRQEVDADEYEQFVKGIGTLTPTERKIFEYYLDGKKVKEIIQIAEIKESTLRYHNQNIYGKLGVNSLKQLLQYASLMKK